MSRRLTASQALGLLRDISSDCSDGEQSDDDINEVENVENSSSDKQLYQVRNPLIQIMMMN